MVTLESNAFPSNETVRGSRTPGPRRPAALPQGETPCAPIRGLPRAWTALGLPDPREGPQGPAARG